MALVLLGTTVAPAAAQSDRNTLVEKLDSLAGSGVLEHRAVGIAATVVRGNDALLLKGYGKADVEWSIPLPADAMFEIGSITKQFTAVALLQLRDEGKLGTAARSPVSPPTQRGIPTPRRRSSC